MVRRFTIAFDDERPIDEVLVAVAPIDAYSGRIVQQNVDAFIEGLPDRPIRNLTGLLVFLKPKAKRDEADATATLPDQEKYQIRVTAEAAGYFDPDPIEFEPPRSNEDSAPAASLRLDVPLLRLPSFAFPEEATLISGVVMRGGEPVAGARIWANLAAGSVLGNREPPRSFETKSDSRGAFVLALRLPAWEGNSDGSRTIVLHVKDGVEHKKMERKVEELRRHVFGKPIDFEQPIETAHSGSPKLLIL